MAALLKAIPRKRDKAMFLMAYRHGLRASEVGMLQVSDIDFKAQRIKLRRLKGSLDGNHNMQPDEVRSLRSYLRNRKVDSPYLFATNRGTPISRASVDYFMKKYAEQAGIPEEKRHFHTLKHSIATHLLDAGADIILSRTGSATRTSRTPLSIRS